MKKLSHRRTISIERMKTFQKALPRLTELHGRFVRARRNNFFYRFPWRLGNSKTVTFRFYCLIEVWLSHIPTSQWEGFQTKVGEAVSVFDEGQKRHWEKLHDVFNEALGAKVLEREFKCRYISSVPISTKAKVKTPDWRGVSAGRPHYVEVKTINHSLDERLSWYSGKSLVHTTVLPAMLTKKIKASYDEAIDQLLAPPDAEGAAKHVVFVVNPDYNVDSIDTGVEQLIIMYLDSIEREGFSISVCVLRT